MSTLEAVHRDSSVPVLVRRDALEASVRAPRAWHADATREAWASEDADWKRTAIFAMGYVRGFEDVVGRVLTGTDSPLFAVAVRAAANNDRIAQLGEPALLRIASSSKDRKLRLAAIEALAPVESKESLALLEELTESRDEERTRTARRRR